MEKSWRGKSVDLVEVDGDAHAKPINVSLTKQGAEYLAWALASYAATRRDKGRTLDLLPETQELLDALNYVLVGDAASRRKHEQLQTGKGMTPDGGYKTPAPINDDRDKGQESLPIRKRGSEWRDRLPDTGERYS